LFYTQNISVFLINAFAVLVIVFLMSSTCVSHTSTRSVLLHLYMLLVLFNATYAASLIFTWLNTSTHTRTRNPFSKLVQNYIIFFNL